MVDYLQVSFKKNLLRILPGYTLLPILYQVYLKSGTYLNFKIFKKWFGHDQFKNPWQKFTLVIIISQNLSIHENAFRLNMLKIRVFWFYLRFIKIITFAENKYLPRSTRQRFRQFLQKWSNEEWIWRIDLGLISRYPKPGHSAGAISTSDLSRGVKTQKSQNFAKVSE